MCSKPYPLPIPHVYIFAVGDIHFHELYRFITEMGSEAVGGVSKT